MLPSDVSVDWPTENEVLDAGRIESVAMSPVHEMVFVAITAPFNVIVTSALPAVFAVGCAV